MSARRSVSAGESLQFQELDPAQKELIYQDLASRDDVGEEPITINFNNGGKRIVGPMFASDAPAQAQGPLSVVAPTQPESTPHTMGALSAVAAPSAKRAPVDMAAMLRDMVGPQGQDQSGKWLALAAAFGKPTQSGSIGETFGNVAQAMQDHKAQQEKLRAQYLPLIMQKVAAQQQAEERAQAQAEAQQVAIQARQQAAAAQQAFQAQQAAAAQQNQASIAEEGRKSREYIASERNDLMRTLSGKNSDIPKLAPGEVWNPNTQTVDVVPGSALWQKQKSAHAKDYGVMQTAITGTDNSLSKINEILDPKNSGAFNSNFGGYNALATQYFPGAADMRKKLESLKSDLKMAGLNLIRGGGSIGQMTEKEWPIVEGMISRIDPTLDEDTARSELQKVAAYMAKIRDNAVSLYQTAWEGSPHYKTLPGAGPTAPAGGAPTPAGPDLAAAATAERARRAAAKK